MSPSSVYEKFVAVSLEVKSLILVTSQQHQKWMHSRSVNRHLDTSNLRCQIQKGGLRSDEKSRSVADLGTLRDSQ